MKAIAFNQSKENDLCCWIISFTHGLIISIPPTYRIEMYIKNQDSQGKRF